MGLVENKLRPLIFRNFFRNIQKIKNGLRPSSVQNFVLSTFPPEGKAKTKAKIKIVSCL